MKTKISGILFIVLISQVVVSNAAPVYDTSGYYDSTGYNQTGNYFVGLSGSYEHHNFFGFDLTGESGVIVSALLRLDTGTYFSADASETYVLYDVSATYSDIGNGTSSTTIYNDLSSGTVHGSRVYTASDNGLIRDIALNSAGIASVQSSLGGFVAFGGALTTLSFTACTQLPGTFCTYDEEFVFGNTFGDTPIYPALVLEYESGGTPVPEPSSLLLLVTGLVGFIAIARRRRVSS